jgi:acetyltransferase-like isoleucine patch superfamily enzyme
VSSALQRVVERLVARLKREPGYRIASGYTDAQLATVLWHRGRQALRGVPLMLRAPNVRGLVLRGRRVVVEHAAQLSAGAGLILEDDACLRPLSREGIVLGRNVTIARGATLQCTGVLAEPGVGIRIGDRSAVGAGAFLGGQGGLAIGADVIMGPHVKIFTENHAFDALDRPMRAQGTRRASVTIADDCWIGAGATILAGVTIGTGCVIAAGAVVTRDVTPYSVVAGVPARMIASRAVGECLTEAVLGTV